MVMLAMTFLRTVLRLEKFLSFLSACSSARNLHEAEPEHAPSALDLWLPTLPRPYSGSFPRWNSLESFDELMLAAVGRAGSESVRADGGGRVRSGARSGGSPKERLRRSQVQPTTSIGYEARRERCGRCWRKPSPRVRSEMLPARLWSVRCVQFGMC